MEQRNVERSIWIDVPRERVWQAITDPAELAQWLLPPALGAQLRRDSNDTILLNMGGMEIPIAILEEVEKLNHLYICLVSRVRIRYE